MSRADYNTPSTKRTEYYSDFMMNMNRNPISGEIARQSDERAVVRSIRNLIHTSRGERLYQPTVGCNLKRLLFEPADETTKNLIIDAITTTIGQHEPRASLKQIVANYNEDSETYSIAITLALVNNPSSLFSFNTVLKRIR